MGGQVTEVLLYCIYSIIGSFSVFSYTRESWFHSSTWSTQTWDYFDLLIEKCLQKCYIFTLKIDNGRLVNICFIQCCYVSVNSKSGNPPDDPPGNVFEMANSPRASTKKVDPWAEKLCYGPILGAIIFEKPAKRHKSLVRSYQNSIELLIFVELLKQ